MRTQESRPALNSLVPPQSRLRGACLSCPGSWGAGRCFLGTSLRGAVALLPGEFTVLGAAHQDGAQAGERQPILHRPGSVWGGRPGQGFSWEPLPAA